MRGDGLDHKRVSAAGLAEWRRKGRREACEMRVNMAVNNIIGILVGGRVDGRCKDSFWEWAEAIDGCRQHRMSSWVATIAQAVAIFEQQQAALIDHFRRN